MRIKCSRQLIFKGTNSQKILPLFSIYLIVSNTSKVDISAVRVPDPLDGGVLGDGVHPPPGHRPPPHRAAPPAQHHGHQRRLHHILQGVKHDVHR